MLYFIGIGSNIGEREQTLNAAIRLLNELGEMVGVAPFYYSQPQGFDSPNEFCNTVVAIDITGLTPTQVLHLCQQIEQMLDGKPHSELLPDGSKRYTDRALDIDLLVVYDQGLEVTCHSRRLTLPHPRMAERDFVLQPLIKMAQSVVKETEMPFVKMHGLGNDYIYLDCTEDTTPLLLLPVIRHFAPLWCDRHRGIGGDGLVFILPDKKADLRMRIFNADGSEAEMCGNAARCVGYYAVTHELVEANRLTLATKGGLRRIEVKDREHISVEMGRPAYTGTQDIDGRTYHCVDVGNPHAVTILGEQDMLTAELVQTVGPQIENNQAFPNRTNVEFCVVLDEHHVAMRVWERGSGETQACGTGATATAVACIRQGLCSSPVTVHLLGGNLTITHTARATRMTGAAEIAYHGRF